MESVWDYPRPPRVEPSAAHVVVELDGEVLAETRRSLRVLETSHPPVFYIPAADVRTERLRPSARRPTVCEFKGTARYYDAGDRPAVAGPTRSPWSGYEAIAGHYAFYPGPGGPRDCRRRAGGGPAGRLLRRLDHLGGDRAVQGRPGVGGLVTGRLRWEVSGRCRCWSGPLAGSTGTGGAASIRSGWLRPAGWSTTPSGSPPSSPTTPSTGCRRRRSSPPGPSGPRPTSSSRSRRAAS